MDKEESREEKLARLMIVFFRRKHMYDQMRKEGSVIDLLKKQRELINIAIDQLNKIGFDPEAYLESDEGGIEYFTFCADEDHQDEIIDRCQSCEHYCPHAEKLCLLHGDELMVICNDYKDTGFDLWQRIQMFEISRCSKCSHHYKEDEKNKCNLNLNMMLPVCPSFQASIEPPNPQP